MAPSCWFVARGNLKNISARLASSQVAWERELELFCNRYADSIESWARRWDKYAELIPQVSVVEACEAFGFVWHIWDVTPVENGGQALAVATARLWRMVRDKLEALLDGTLDGTRPSAKAWLALTRLARRCHAYAAFDAAFQTWADTLARAVETRDVSLCRALLSPAQTTPDSLLMEMTALTHASRAAFATDRLLEVI